MVQQATGRRLTSREVRQRFRNLQQNNQLGIIDTALDYIDLESRIHELHQDGEKNLASVVDVETLLAGARLAKDEHLINMMIRPEDVENRVWDILVLQHSKSFWKGGKDQLITLSACFLASFSQGWIQVTTGNTDWPGEFGVKENTITFGFVNAIMWFSAATIGSFLLQDPIAHRYVGRRGALLFAAALTFAGAIWSSRTKSWQELVVARIVLGIGVGGKSTVAPIYEAEVLPPSQRGRLLVAWQAFVSLGIFGGACAQFIYNYSWRSQVCSGALPAFILAILTFAASESPRWLMIQGKYDEAFKVLVRLRGEKVLAAKELCFIHYSMQVERWLYSEDIALDRGATQNVAPDDDDPFRIEIPRVKYMRHLWNFITFERNYRAAIVSGIVMIAQQLSGVNIFAFLGTSFYRSLSIGPSPSNSLQQRIGPDKAAEWTLKLFSFKLAIVFGVSNAVFSIMAYFLIEKNNMSRLRHVQGRRFLLCCSLLGGALSLLGMGLCLQIEPSVRTGVFIFWLVFFTFWYSPGAGAIPFLLSAEVPSGEDREISMSFAILCNFTGAGVLSLLVPLGLGWGQEQSQLYVLYIFVGLSCFAFIMVWLYVPSTNQISSLEDMSYVFGKPLNLHAMEQINNLFNRCGKLFSILKPRTEDIGPGDLRDSEPSRSFRYNLEHYELHTTTPVTERTGPRQQQVNGNEARAPDLRP